MAAVDFMRTTLDFIHRGFRGAPEGLTSWQLNHVPEGHVHSIAWCMWHAARIEDLFFQQLFQGKPQEWDSGGWSVRTGLPEKGFGTGQSHEEAHAVRIDRPSEFAAYAERVQSLAVEFLAGIGDADLSREVKLGQRTETLGESINLHIVIHLNGHRGEINLLRGMMGFEPVLLNQGG